MENPFIFINYDTDIDDCYLFIYLVSFIFIINDVHVNINIK